MKRVIVDYAKLTNEILNLLVEKFPDGYDDSDIVRFRNAKNELVEAVEVRTEDTIYLVKVSTKLSDRIENYDEDEEIDDVIEPRNTRFRICRGLAQLATKRDALPAKKHGNIPM